MNDEISARLKELRIFLRLGCTSFGGPIAHLGPVCSTAIHSALDLLVAAAALVLLTAGKVRPWMVVLAVVLASVLIVR